MEQFEDNLVVDLEAAVKTKNTLQPYIHFVGDYNKIENIFVIFENVKYQFKTFLEALTFCFHVYVVFDLEYPKATSNLWIFIQKFFFEIDFKNVTVSTSIKSFINTINQKQ